MTVEAEIIGLVHKEAQLLDDWRLDEWLEMYDDEARYWIPIDEHADPERTSSIIHETKPMLRLRVEQLMRENRLAQSPRSQMMRLIGNIVVTPEEGGLAAARYNLMMMELRSGDWRQQGLGEKRFFAGRCEIRAARKDGAWRILNKTITLLDRKQPVYGMSFIL